MEIAVARYTDSGMAEDNGMRTVDWRGVLLAFSQRGRSRIYASTSRHNVDDSCGRNVALQTDSSVLDIRCV